MLGPFFPLRLIDLNVDNDLKPCAIFIAVNAVAAPDKAAETGFTHSKIGLPFLKLKIISGAASKAAPNKNKPPRIIGAASPVGSTNITGFPPT